jgi:predicted TIM-barrel fold metal-dependent hydrolase
MYAETAARFGDLASQDSKKVASFFEKYQDRLMFGSDYGNSRMEGEMTEEQLRNEKESLNTRYENLWKYLSSSDSMELRRQKTKGLGLSKQVLNKVYHQNITDLLKLE